MSSARRVRDKWRSKDWYTIVSPEYFGGVELGSVPADEESKLIGRSIETTLYSITGDFSHQHIKLNFQVNKVDEKRATTIFKGHEYSRDYLRSLVRRRTSCVDGIFDVTTKDGYKIRVSVCGFTLARIKTSQQKAIRRTMKEIIEKRGSELDFNQFVHEMVLGKIASDIYNEAKNICPLRHIGIRKSKLISIPTISTGDSVESNVP
ncbi:MAG: 30S ribosomal protein S3ae [Candidatus Bathyarchaeia archaeon]